MQEIKYKCYICRKEIENSIIQHNWKGNQYYFCNLKHRAYFFFKIKENDLFKLDLKSYYKENGLKKELEERFVEYIKYLKLQDNKIIYNSIKSDVTTLIEFFMNNDNFSLYQLLLSITLEIIEKLRNIEKTKKLEIKWKEFDDKIGDLKDFIEECEGFYINMIKYPNIFNVEKVLNLAFLLRFVEIKLKEIDLNVIFISNKLPLKTILILNQKIYNMNRDVGNYSF